MTKVKVFNNWLDGKSGRSSYLKTDGSSIWSQNVKLGYTTDDGKKGNYDYSDEIRNKLPKTVLKDLKWIGGTTSWRTTVFEIIQ